LYLLQLYASKAAKWTGTRSLISKDYASFHCQFMVQGTRTRSAAGLLSKYQLAKEAAVF
jgi:hypothetical protein